MEMNIEPYKYADQIDYNPKNQRKLYTTRRDKKTYWSTSQKGFTLVATKFLRKMDI